MFEQIRGAALVLLTAFQVSITRAQVPDVPGSTPEGTVAQLFASMRSVDTVALRAVFWPGAQLQRIDAQGKVQANTVNDFVRSIGSLPRDFADERVGRMTVRQDATLAIAWVPYALYAGGKFHHCGTNAFTLRRDNATQRWRIQAGVYTDRSTDCPSLDDAPTLAALDTVMNAWHHAAATADEAVFFGTMSADGIYLGTDATERWLRDSMAVWAAPFFARDTAWAFTPRERHWMLSEDGQTAWFDEHLDSWMGVVRGSGVLTKVANASTPFGKTRWQLCHYNLALAVPNDAMEAVRKAIDPKAVPR